MRKIEVLNNKYISVIVSAYDRKKYLLEALKSVTDQSLPRDTYEIILVKNLNDETIDKFAEQNNIHFHLKHGNM